MTARPTLRGRDFFRLKAGRRDGPHAAIRDALRALCLWVIDLAGVGDGCADLLVFTRYAMPMFIEVKTAKGKLRAKQLAFAARAKSMGVRYEVAHDVQEAIAVADWPQPRPELMRAKCDDSLREYHAGGHPPSRTPK